MPGKMQVQEQVYSVELASVGKIRVFWPSSRCERGSGFHERENYNRVKRAAKLAIFNAKNAERLKFCKELGNVDQKGDVFRVAK